MARTISFVAAVILFSIALFAQGLPRANFLPLVEKQSEQIAISIQSPKDQGSYYLHYRTAGMKNFQIRKMRISGSGLVSHWISTKNLYGKNLEFFIVEKKMNGSKAISPTHTIANFTQKESPEIYFQSNDAMASQSPKREPLLNINASLSTSTKLSDNSEYPGQNYTANGNLRIYRNIVKNNYQLDFDTNFVHIDPYDKIENRINLSSMMVRIKKDGMQFEAGDVAVNETEFTTSYLNRRGVRFELNKNSFYLNSFYTNSQQKTGFDGYGIPDAKAGIFGAVLGINLKNVLVVRGMFMTGKDNLDSKTVSTTENPYRQGDIFSLWSELNLFKNRLKIAGEISSSNYGAAPDKEHLEKDSDTAWKTGLKYNHGILSFAADYEAIGDKFNSIANLFLQNDREGLSTNLGLNIKTFSWNIAYIDKKNYMNNPIQDMLHQKRAGTTFNWGIGSHFRIGADLSRDNLDYDSSTGLQTSSSDMSTNNYSASFGYMAGSNGININLGKTESLTFTSNLNASLALNLRFGKFMTLNPTLSYQSNENLCDQTTSTIYNVYLNSEITFIPQFFTLTVSLSYMNNEGENNSSSNWSASGNLNFFMAQIFKNRIRPSLSIKSQFQGSTYGSIKTNSAIFHLQADIAF